ncbi:hypothetical protein ACF1BK_10815 [Streptomyces globisporus]|uniref:hypothetical protein n=1 Tax=Streptomyces globisporus TaxID=1908 RepID=UPI0036FD1F4C
MSRLLRILAVGLTATALAATLDVPAHAAASACTHHLSGPQVCISTNGASGSENPGRVTTAWTNPPEGRRTATVHITEPGGQRYTLTGYTPEERTEGGALLMSNHGMYGPGGRSDYEPRPGDPDRWDWQGDTP